MVVGFKSLPMIAQPGKAKLPFATTGRGPKPRFATISVPIFTDRLFAAVWRRASLRRYDISVGNPAND
jgi:hypothetical protein